MNLFKRGGIWWYSFTHRGIRTRQSTGETEKRLAQVVAARAWKKVRDQGIAALLHEPPTLAEFSKEFLDWVRDTHSIEDNTKRYYRHGWKMLGSTKLAGMKMDAITNHDCEITDFPGNGSTANQALRTLRRMFAKAKEVKQFYGELPEIKLRKEWPRSIAMSVSDVERIAGLMKGDPRDALLVLRATGMRPKELYSSRWEYVRWAESLYSNPKGKTSTARRAVPLLGESVAILKRRHLEQGSPIQGWIFPSDSKSGHMVGIGKAFTAARRAARLPEGMVVYAARHGFLTDVAKVVSLKAVMDIGGHADTRTATRYQHPNVAEIQAKLASIQTRGAIQ